jgi:hypothetical protein
MGISARLGYGTASMGLFWNLAAGFLVLSAVPIESLDPFRMIFVVVMSVSVAAAVLAEERSIARPR